MRLGSECVCMRHACAEGFSFLSSFFYLGFSRRDGFDMDTTIQTRQRAKTTEERKRNESPFILVMLSRDWLSFLAPSPASLPYQSVSFPRQRLGGRARGLICGIDRSRVMEWNIHLKIAISEMKWSFLSISSSNFGRRIENRSGSYLLAIS